MNCIIVYVCVSVHTVSCECKDRGHWEYIISIHDIERHVFAPATCIQTCVIYILYYSTSTWAYNCIQLHTNHDIRIERAHGFAIVTYTKRTWEGTQNLCYMHSLWERESERDKIAAINCIALIRKTLCMVDISECSFAFYSIRARRVPLACVCLENMEYYERQFSCTHWRPTATQTHWEIFGAGALPSMAILLHASAPQCTCVY